ncbi:hypothetical protein [Cryobacterium zhongshanensis]|uniref:Uncharacterized protein n=1 Tax=Cryobacterium zhongshanensis TaxID=2928153 RepID=A0AA41QZA3_9MICO|nr:hypothetical protein [Cryobacterium zhongshanensis]MCI4659613.1 hypothetical protein [Cryobacterium zhongshanensis]
MTNFPTTAPATLDEPEAPIAPTAAPAAPRAKRDNEYAGAYANFIEQTKNHVLTVGMDNGLNRQMRVGAPGTGMWSWNVITWPHYLATVGDIADGFTFSRVTDMMDFFDREGHGDYYSDGAPSIDFRYWAEKLSGGRSQEVREYSDKIFIQHVKDHLEEDEDLGTEAQDEYEKVVTVSKRVCARHGVDYDEWLTELRKSNPAATYLEINEDDAEEIEFFGMPIPERSPAERSAEILEEAHRYADNEVEAHDWLRENQVTFGQDAYWDWSMKDYNVHFLFACWAIELTVRLWREYEASPEAEAHRNPGDGYVLVEGGLVQNNPALPVFDLDVLDTDAPDEETAHEVLDLYERINAHPTARIERANILVGAAKFVARHGSAADKAAVATLETARLAEKPAAPRPIE